MLVLHRQEGESIIINDNIEVKVEKIFSSGKVKLSITAPRSVTIYRKEVLEAIKHEKKLRQIDEQANRNQS